MAGRKQGLSSKSKRFFDLFASDLIQIILDKDTESTEQTEDTISVNKMPIVVEGYLVDEDDDYVYIGQQPTAINQAVSKDFIIHVQVITEEESVLKIPDMPPDAPKDPKGYN